MSDPAENRDVRGNTIKPHSVEAENVKAQNATVESEPSDANEIARKVDIDAKADLDSTTGVLKSSQVPDLAITSVSTVPDKASRLALSVEEGDVAIQTDTDTTYIFTGGDPSVNANWSEIVLDVLDAISGSTISPDTVNAGSVNTGEVANGGSPVSFNDNVDLNGNKVIDDSNESDASYFMDTEWFFPDGDVITFAPEGAAAMVYMSATAGDVCLFLLDFQNDAATIVSNPSSHYSTTEGNQGTVNIFYDGTDSEFKLENETGDTEYISWHFFGR